MLKLAFLIGLYSYAILILSMFGILYPNAILTAGFLVVFIGFLIYKSQIDRVKASTFFKEYKKQNFWLILLMIIFAAVNVIGVLGPELAFDALWYHLTIPKIFLLQHKIYFIQGGLFYYSLMPKLVEMLYGAALAIGNEIPAKFIHYLFGLGTVFVTYKIARIYLPRKYSLLSSLVFYSNLVVGWLSISAYVDLARAFFESMALLYFLYFTKDYSRRLLIASGLLLGLAVSTKIVSLISIPIFIGMVLMTKINLRSKSKNSILFVFCALLAPFPWFVISYFYTKNPFFPLFSSYSPQTLNFDVLHPFVIGKNLISVFLFSNDPISPVYLVALPLILISFKKLLMYSYLTFYAFFSIVLWYLSTYSGLWHASDQAGSARFLTSYLPALSILAIILFYRFKKHAIGKIGIAVVITVAVSSILYRAIANYKFVPVLLGTESKQDFLMKNLNFSFGDFYDENSEIKKIVGNNRVELVNMHNLYYVDFPFTLREFNDEDEPEYVLVQNSVIPAFYKSADLVYKNEKTHVKLYKL